MIDSSIVIVADLPPAPLLLVDAGFVQALEEAEEAISKLKVTDAATAATAADLQSRLTKAGTALESERKKLLRPFIDTQKAINDAAAGTAARIELGKRAVKVELTRYDDAQRQLAAEAERKRQAEAAEIERKRQAEICRLEEIARKEREEAKRQADELLAKQAEAEKQRLAAEIAAKPAVEDLDADPAPIAAPAPDDELDLADAPPVEKSDTEKQLDALKYAPPVVAAAPIVAPKIAGVMFRNWIEVVTVDPALLPDAFVIKTADTKLIRSTFITGWKEGQPLPVCPGVVFEIKRESITR